MAIPHDQLARAEALLIRREDRVRPEIRDRLQLKHRIDRNSIVLFEWRPRMFADEWGETPVAKFTFVQSTNRWKLLWMGGNLKWRSYQSLPEADSFESLFREVDADPYGCFWG